MPFLCYLFISKISENKSTSSQDYIVSMTIFHFCELWDDKQEINFCGFNILG